MNVQKRFLEDQVLLNECPSFETLGRQLNFLANCPDSFEVEPSKETQLLARRYYDHLINHGQINENLEHSLIYLQSRRLVSSFLGTFSM